MFKLFWYKVFYPLKINNTQFPDGFRQKFYVFLNLSLHREEDSVSRKLICVHGVQYKFKLAAILTWKGIIFSNLPIGKRETSRDPSAASTMPISCVIFTSLKVRVKLLRNQSVCGRRQRDRTVRLLTGSWICSRQAQVQMDVTAHLSHYYHIPFEFYPVFLLFLILVSFTIHKLT